VDDDTASEIRLLGARAQRVEPAGELDDRETAGDRAEGSPVFVVVLGG
jgi:hypothetical protein